MKTENLNLTRRQREIFDFLKDQYTTLPHPITLDVLCRALGLESRGSLLRHIQVMIAEGLIEPLNHRSGIRLTERVLNTDPLFNEDGVPVVGKIAAGKPIEAIENLDYLHLPEHLKPSTRCFILQVSGDSMKEAGILDGDLAIIEQRTHARNGEIVVALIDQTEATLKFIEQYPHEIVLIPANSQYSPQYYRPDQVQIQGVLSGLMRSYRPNRPMTPENLS